jgi:hypothetical protein
MIEWERMMNSLQTEIARIGQGGLLDGAGSWANHFDRRSIFHANTVELDKFLKVIGPAPTLRLSYDRNDYSISRPEALNPGYELVAVAT